MLGVCHRYFQKQREQRLAQQNKIEPRGMFLSFTSNRLEENSAQLTLFFTVPPGYKERGKAELSEEKLASWMCCLGGQWPRVGSSGLLLRS